MAFAVPYLFGKAKRREDSPSGCFGCHPQKKFLAFAFGRLCRIGSGATSMKSELLEKIRTELKARLDRLAKAARDAHAAATDPDSKAEGKYDTRSLEASYLAAGQARQVDETAEAVKAFDALVLADFAIDDAIAMGAWVEVEMRGETCHFLLAPAAGGMVVEINGVEITLLTPESPLYQNLLGKRTGDFLEAAELMVLEVG
jgi:transcription elongation GreA/GreB family factor